MSKTTGWVVTKRDGRTEGFRLDKVEGAILKCLESGMGRPRRESQSVSKRVADMAVNLLDGQDNRSPTVEDVQRAIIHQLWADGQYDAAEHFTLYREQRRREREEAESDPEAAELIREDAEHFPSPLQYFQFVDKYSRWNPKARRRETWSECCDRVFDFLKSRRQLLAVRAEEWLELRQALYEHRASPAMRLVQMAGPALERCNAGAFNCCYIAVDCFDAFVESLYLLMQGCGVGFSVESSYVDELPRIKKQKGSAPVQHKIDDSTEGWCSAYRLGLEQWSGGGDVEYDYSAVREAGAVLRTKGGRASGPEPLKRLLTFAKAMLLRKQGKYLGTKDCHDLMCVTGKIVQVGGVRRASEISLSDLNDSEMRDAKSGNWWDSSPWLDMSNNSAVYEEKPDAITFMREWLSLAESGSGERGIFNRESALKTIPKRRKKAKFGLNPCAEVYLRSCQMCNLSIAVARPEDTEETLAEKVRIAAVFGTLQSALTDFQYVRPIWKQNCDEECLLGVDINGQMDCPILRPGAPGRSTMLRRLRDLVVRTNVEWASRLGINPSTASTVVKPSGNSAAFFGCSSGMHARWSKYQVRRVRVSRSGPMGRLLADQGVPFAADPHNESLLVFDFLPDPAPEGTPTRNDMTAVEQFRNWLEWKENYTEHNPSCTIYVGPDEWLELGAEVHKEFDRVGGLSFLPKDSGNYMLTPNEELTEEDYLARKAAFPTIDWSKLSRYEVEDSTDVRAEPACAGGSCET